MNLQLMQIDFKTLKYVTKVTSKAYSSTFNDSVYQIKWLSTSPEFLFGEISSSKITTPYGTAATRNIAAVHTSVTSERSSIMWSDANWSKVPTGFASAAGKVVTDSVTNFDRGSSWQSQTEPREDGGDLRNEDFWLHALYGLTGSSEDVDRDVSIDLNSPPYF